MGCDNESAGEKDISKDRKIKAFMDRKVTEKEKGVKLIMIYFKGRTETRN